MKKIFTILTLLMFGIMSWATPSITAADVNFGSVVLTGDYVEGELNLPISWEDLPLWSQVEIEILNAPDEDCLFGVDGNDVAYVWTGSGESYDPIIYAYNCAVSYFAEAVGDYACNIHIYVEDPDNYGVILVEKTINVSLSVVENTTGIEDAAVKAKASKILRDDQIYILRGDRTYTLTGQEVK